MCPTSTFQLVSYTLAFLWMGRSNVWNFGHHKWQQWFVSGVAVLPVDGEVLLHLSMPQEVMPVNAGSGTAR